MTLQEIYTKVKAHLLAQNAKSAEGTSILDRPFCLYRGPGGLKCAVGALIPDALYNPDLEGNGADGQAVIKVLVQAGVLDSANPDAPAARLLDQLQGVHDMHEPQEWPEALAGVARRFDLEDV